MKKMALLAAALAVGGACAPVMAHDTGAYVRREAGDSQIEWKNDFGSLDIDDTSASVRVGYWLTPYLAVEAFYRRYRNEEEHGINVISAVDAYGAGVVAKKNFGAGGDGMYVSGRLGAVEARTEIETTGFIRTEGKEVAPYIGVGVGYDFGPSFGVGLQYDYEKTEPFSDGGFSVEIEARTLTLAAEYRF